MKKLILELKPHRNSWRNLNTTKTQFGKESSCVLATSTTRVFGGGRSRGNCHGIKNESHAYNSFTRYPIVLINSLVSNSECGYPVLCNHYCSLLKNFKFWRTVNKNFYSVIIPQNNIIVLFCHSVIIYEILLYIWNLSGLSNYFIFSFILGKWILNMTFQQCMY